MSNTTDPRFIDLMRPALWRLAPEKLAELITYAEERLPLEKLARARYAKMILDAARAVKESRENPEPYAIACPNCGSFYTAIGHDLVCLACLHHHP